MPLIYQHRISRADLRANPDVLYIFGDNCARVGLGGQAAAMRGEPNAVGVRTKRQPNMRPSAFFSDSDAFECQGYWASDLAPVREHHQRGGIVVIPLDGIGTGFAKLSPTLLAILDLEIAIAGGARAAGVPVREVAG